MAMHNFQQGLDFASKTKDFQECADLHYSIAVIFEDRGDYIEALKHYEICEKYGKNTNNKPVVGKALMGIGGCYAKKGQYAESIELLKESINILEKTEDLDELAKANTNLGSTYFYVDMDESIRWHEKCIEISTEIGDIRMLGYGL